jgi:hypothetical protein
MDVHRTKRMRSCLKKGSIRSSQLVNWENMIVFSPSLRSRISLSSFSTCLIFALEGGRPSSSSSDTWRCLRCCSASCAAQSLHVFSPGFELEALRAVWQILHVRDEAATVSFARPATSSSAGSSASASPPSSASPFDAGPGRASMASLSRVKSLVTRPGWLQATDTLSSIFMATMTIRTNLDADGARGSR